MGVVLYKCAWSLKAWRNPLSDKDSKDEKPADYEIVEGVEFSDGFSADAIAKASETDILPALRLSEVVTEESPITVRFDGAPRLVKSSKLPKGKAWFIDVVVGEQRMSMVIPDSLRFSMLTLQRHNDWSSFDGQVVVVSCATGRIKTGKFEGEAKTYKASLPA